MVWALVGGHCGHEGRLLLQATPLSVAVVGFGVGRDLALQAEPSPEAFRVWALGLGLSVAPS